MRPPAGQVIDQQSGAGRVIDGAEQKGCEGVAGIRGKRQTGTCSAEVVHAWADPDSESARPNSRVERNCPGVLRLNFERSEAADLGH